MKNPDQYILCDEDTILTGGFSNLEWGKNEALNRAKASGKSQIIYRLVPIQRVEVKITREYPVTEIEP